VLLAKEETVLQGMIDRLTEFERCDRLKINVEKPQVVRISRESSPVETVIDQKQLEKVGHFNYLRSMITNNARCTCKIKCRSVMAKPAFRNKKTLFTRKLDLNLRKKLVKCYV
jgi:hypothetical protein